MDLHELPQKPVSSSIVPSVFGMGDGYEELRCPCCGYLHQHVCHPFWRPEGTAWVGRGKLLTIPIEGECGSLWEICMGTHKGVTFCVTRISRDCREIVEETRP